jgi:hypothetical protein
LRICFVAGRDVSPQTVASQTHHPRCNSDSIAFRTAASLLSRYSRAEISAIELRRALGGVTYGDVLIELARRDLPLPRASQVGREQAIAAARALLFHRVA